MADSTFKVAYRFGPADRELAQVTRVAYVGAPNAERAAALVKAAIDFPVRSAIRTEVERIGEAAPFVAEDRSVLRRPENRDVRVPVRWSPDDGAYLYPVTEDTPVPVRVVAQRLVSRFGVPRPMVLVQPTRNRGRRFRTDRLYGVALDSDEQTSTNLYARNRVTRGGRPTIHTHDVSGLPALDSWSAGNVNVV